MADPNEALMLQFLTWVASRRRSYDEAMGAWQTTCPRHTIWEDAIIEGLIEIRRDTFQSEVVLTSRGRAILAGGNAAAALK